MSVSTIENDGFKPYRVMTKNREDSDAHWLTRAAADTEEEAWAYKLINHYRDDEKRVVRLVICDPPARVWERDHEYAWNLSSDVTYQPVTMVCIGVASNGSAAFEKPNGEIATRYPGARANWTDIADES